MLTDKQMILSPDDWPKWPFLPMIRRGENPGSGIIYGDPKDDKVLFIPNVNLWRLSDEDMEQGSLRNIDELLAEGWQVD